MLNLLAQRRSLWITFVATLLITLAFPLVNAPWELSLIDAIADPEQVRQAIRSMSAEQKTAHAWITATLDVAYPLAYGAWFIGSALCFYGRWGRLLAALFFLLIATDLLEGVVQVLALTEIADLVDAKAVLTPLKFGLFLLGLATTLVGWVIWLVSRFRAKTADRLD